MDLVIGGAGFIGSHLVEALPKRGERVGEIGNFAEPGTSIELEYAKPCLGEAEHSLVSAATGYAPSRSFDQGLRETFVTYARQGGELTMTAREDGPRSPEEGR